MAGVEHDDPLLRPEPLALRRGLRRRGDGAVDRGIDPVLGCELPLRLGEFRDADRLQIENQAIRMGLGRRQDDVVDQPGRPLDIDDEPAVARLEQAETVTAYDPARRMARRLGDLPFDLGKVDHDPVGVLEREDAVRHLGAQLDDHPSLVRMHADTDLGHVRCPKGPDRRQQKGNDRDDPRRHFILALSKSAKQRTRSLAKRKSKAAVMPPPGNIYLIKICLQLNLRLLILKVQWPRIIDCRPNPSCLF